MLFDLDDTLHDDTAAFVQAARRVADDVARTYGVEAEALARAYVSAAESFWVNLTDRDLAVPLVSVRSRMWLQALQRVGLDRPELADRAAADYNRYRKEYLTLFPGALELLGSLRARGLKLGLITNGFAETHREKITLLRLDDAFDEIFIADEVGLMKPDRRIFEHACRRLGTSPERAAMVGDRFDRDVRGGQAAGLYTVWFNPHGHRVPEGALPPDAVVAGIAAVPAALPP
ncbi:MAG TPA: HAD family hydrolase [Candidatus Acidoferrales bacterium]|nr:HAD family hydrolase [Candidatus Acidoferrales bacterium]